MNSKTTSIWFVIAAALAGAIFAVHQYLQPPAAGPVLVLPNLSPASVTSIEIHPTNAPEIQANLTNGNWALIQPMVFPAQSAAIEALLDALQRLTAAPRISAAELLKHKDADAQYGLTAAPRLVIESDNQRWQIIVGKKTAPGDAVYLRVVGVPGAFVTDANWLKLIPRSADDWRDRSLAGVMENFDSILVTNGIKGLAMAFHRDPGTRLWRMTQPLQARADSGHIAELLQRIQQGEIQQFIGVSSTNDLAHLGLQPPNLTLSLAGAGLPVVFQLGNALTNDASRIYGERVGLDTVFTTVAATFAPWYGAVNSFRDTNLLELTAPVAEIEMRGPGTNHFVLRREGTNDWKIPGYAFPVDAANVELLIRTLASLHIADFVKDAVTPADLPAYGLDKPSREIILRPATGGSNNVIANVELGTNQNNEVYVRRPRENFIYGITMEDYNRLPEQAWEFRSRRIWNFNVNDVTQVLLDEAGRKRRILHGGPGKWDLAADSTGILDENGTDQAVQELAHLTAVGWAG
ncbi:MAG: DUF4340 domain-containing protein, partial [Verrucomicrobia bacterium]|nr:DUF4340 domain-containing protein [Verrucomicrobiota bacterium]